MTEPKQRAPFKSSVTDYEAIRKRRDELVPPPYGGQKPVEEPQPRCVPIQDDFDYGCSPALAVLADLRTWNALPLDVRCRAAAAGCRERLPCP